MYSLNGETLVSLLNEMPSYRRFVLLRSVRRRSHFLSILQDIKNFTELERKIKRSTDYSIDNEQLAESAMGLNQNEQGAPGQIHHVDPNIAKTKELALARDPFAMHTD